MKSHNYLLLIFAAALFLSACVSSDDDSETTTSETLPITTVIPVIPVTPVTPLTEEMLIGRYEVENGNRDFQMGRIQYEYSGSEDLRWIDDIGNSWVFTFSEENEQLIKLPDELDTTTMTYNILRVVDAETGLETNEISGLELDGVVFEKLSSDGAAYFDPDDAMIGDNDLDKFIENNGGVDEYSEKTLFILESFLKAEELYYAGKYDLAQTLVDAVWAAYPRGSDWYQETPTSIRLGWPPAYTGMLMLTEALRYRQLYGAHEPTTFLKHTFVEIGCIDAVIPTTIEEKEAIEGVLETRYLSDEMTHKIYNQSYRLFGEYLEAMTNGVLQYQIDVVRVADDECHEGKFSGGTGNFAGVTNYGAVPRLLGSSAFNQSDLFTIVYPSILPPKEGDFETQFFVTGGMGRVDEKAVFMLDDAYLLNKPRHYGGGVEWFDIDRRAYLPHWVNHEFFHSMFGNYFKEYNLEPNGHAWLNQDNWPTDFEGRYEPDYFFEALDRRFRDASPSIASRFMRGTPTTEEMDFLTSEILVGKYEMDHLYEDYDTAVISLNADGSLLWTDKDGDTKNLELDKTLGTLASSGAVIQFQYDDSNGSLIPGAISGIMINSNIYHKVD